MRSRGFSLIELLFALLILTIIMMTTLAMFTERKRQLQQAADTIAVYQALANEAEVIRRTDFAELDALDGSIHFQTDTAILSQLGSFSTLTTVTPGPPGIKNVTLRVTWRGKKEAKLTLLRSNTGGTNLW